jgi:putative hydrolase of the HAD superfamily
LRSYHDWTVSKLETANTGENSGAAPHIQAVLFDAAGTLIDPSEPVGETYAHVARQFGVELPAWRLSDAFGRVVRRAGPRLGQDAATANIAELERRWWRGIVRSTFLAADSTVRFDDFEGFFDALFECFAEPQAWVLRPGAREALATLGADKCLLGIVSNFDYRLPKILEGLAIAGYFDTVTIPSSCRIEKPDSGIFEAALRQLGVAAERAVYVGHHPRLDLAAASAAGLHVLDVDALRDLHQLPARLRALANLG